MSRFSIVFGLALVASALAVDVNTAYAQAAWRCHGDDCEEDLINDIEDVTMRDWPSSQTIAVPGLPYTCTTKPASASDPSVASARTRSASRAPVVAQGSVSGAVPWSISLSGSLRSFLAGRFSASADVLGTIQASVDGSLWGASINYLFRGACDPTLPRVCTDVMAPAGPTGVPDLGAVAFSTAAGDFWTGALRFSFEVPTSETVVSCKVGYPANVVTVYPRDGLVQLSYPVASTPAKDAIAEAIRDVFRRAVRIVVTGSP